MIPTFTTRENLLEYARHLDGVLLPGSTSDIDPSRYGEVAHPRLGKLVPERDALDFALLQHAEQENLPVMGICFGIQSLNVFRGGTLVQDIPALVDQAVFHDDHGEPEQPARHPVRLTRGSLLERLAGRDLVEVNSFHHQSAGKVGKNLHAVATAPDGVIEALEGSSDRFVLGVQWHPERDFRENTFSQSLFATFVQEAAKSKTHSPSV
jgi:putative glutamine amidotransferase